MTKRQQSRIAALMPGGVPRYVRCYDAPEEIERYTVVFSGNYACTKVPHRHERWVEHISMNIWGGTSYCEHTRALDVNKSGFAPAIGGKCRLGLRIPFDALPEVCRKVVVYEYREIWGI